MTDILLQLLMMLMFVCTKQELGVYYISLPVEKYIAMNVKKNMFYILFMFKVIHIHQIVYVFQQIVN